TLPDDDAAQGWAPVLRVISGVVAMVGVLFVLPGMLGVAGGLGVLFKKQWGRVLTFLVAAVAILSGVAVVAVSDVDVSSTTLGAAQIVYGVAAFVVLIRKADEFSRLEQTLRSDLRERTHLAERPVPERLT